MTQHSRVIQWLCLSVLLCFLSSAIISAAQEANKTPPPIQPPAPQSSAEPGIPPQSQEYQPDSKGGDAAAVASVAKLAVDMNNETVKRIETFYSNTVQDFTLHITIVAALVGLVGVASVILIAKRTAKRQANKALGPVRQRHSEILSDHEIIKREHGAMYAALQTERQEYETLRRDFRDFQEKAVGNVRGLLTI
jgi:hypothetical protein